MASDAVIRSDSTAPCDISTRLDQLHVSTKSADDTPPKFDFETKPQAYDSDTERSLETKPSEAIVSKFPSDFDNHNDIITINIIFYRGHTNIPLGHLKFRSD